MKWSSINQGVPVLVASSWLSNLLLNSPPQHEGSFMKHRPQQGLFSDMKHQGLYPDWKPLLASWWVDDLGNSPARWDSERQGISEASVLLTSMASLVCHWGESLSCWVECSGPVSASLRLSWPWSNSCTASNYQVSSNFSFLICKMEFILFFVSIKIK